MTDDRAPATLPEGRFEFDVDVPDQDDPDWDRTKRELEPPRKWGERLKTAPVRALFPVVVVVALVGSVDRYKTDWAMLPAQEKTNIADANARIRAAQIASEVSHAAGLRQRRAQGATAIDIVFTTIGPTTVVRVQPTASIALSAIVDGTDGYHGVFSLRTNDAGESSFSIPTPSRRPVLDRIVVSTGDSTPTGSTVISSRASFVW